MTGCKDFTGTEILLGLGSRVESNGWCGVAQQWSCHLPSLVLFLVTVREMRLLLFTCEDIVCKRLLGVIEAAIHEMRYSQQEGIIIALQKYRA